MASQGVDAAYITRPVSVAYLTGFRSEPMERLMALAIRPEGATLIVPALEKDHAVSAVVHLAGAPIARRWSRRARRAIRESRVTGTANLIAGLTACEPRPATLLCASGAGYYGARGEEPLDEEAPPGRGFLAEVSAAWEAE